MLRCDRQSAEATGPTPLPARANIAISFIRRMNEVARVTLSRRFAPVYTAYALTSAARAGDIIRPQHRRCRGQPSFPRLLYRFAREWLPQSCSGFRDSPAGSFLNFHAPAPRGWNHN